MSSVPHEQAELCFSVAADDALLCVLPNRRDPEAEQFETLPLSVLSMFSYAVGGATYYLSTMTHSSAPLTATVICIVYQLVVSMVLMSLLIGVMTNAMAKVSKHENLRLQLSRTEIIAELDAVIPDWIKSRFRPQWRPRYIYVLRVDPRSIDRVEQEYLWAPLHGGGENGKAGGGDGSVATSGNSQQQRGVQESGDREPTATNVQSQAAPAAAAVSLSAASGKGLHSPQQHGRESHNSTDTTGHQVATNTPAAATGHLRDVATRAMESSDTKDSDGGGDVQSTSVLHAAYGDSTYAGISSSTTPADVSNAAESGAAGLSHKPNTMPDQQGPGSSSVGGTSQHHPTQDAATASAAATAPQQEWVVVPEGEGLDSGQCSPGGQSNKDAAAASGGQKPLRLTTTNTAAAAGDDASATASLHQRLAALEGQLSQIQDTMRLLLQHLGAEDR